MLPDKRGYEYRLKGKKTLFETFLQYSDEKRKASKVLGAILKEKYRYSKHKKLRVLDVGSGNGYFLDNIIRCWKTKRALEIHLLEPSEFLLPALKKTIEKSLTLSTASIYPIRWEQFHTELTFDFILASHLYHISVKDYPEEFLRMINYLKPSGLLILIFRGKDDVYQLKNIFKRKLFGSSFKAKTSYQVTKALKQISKNKIPLTIEKYNSRSRLIVPMSNKVDTITLIEFYLNKPWSGIPSKIRQGILKYLERKEGVLNQLDEIIIVSRN